MNNETLQLIRFSLFGGDRPVISDWPSVLADLRKQAIMPLADPSFFPECPALAEAYYRNAGTFVLHGEAIKELNAIFVPHRPVILKGFAAAQYYPRPAARTLGDIDFMVHDMPFDDAAALLQSNGFTCTDSIGQELTYPRHKAFRKASVQYELHRYFSNGINEKDTILEGILANSEPVERQTEGVTLHSYPDVVNGLVLLEHIEHHLHSGLGIRPMLDWACYVDKVLTDESWQNEFKDLAERTGLKQLAVYVTLLCETYLGGPHRTFAEDADPHIAELLMEEISDAGNFGRGREKTQTSVALFRQSSNPFKRLQSGGLNNWKYSWKHKWVRPFAWLYQMFHIAGKLTHGGFGAGGLKAARSVENRQDILFQALGLGRYET